MNPETPTQLVLFGAAAFLLLVSPAVNAADPRPFKVAPVLPDVIELPSPAAVHLEGFLGARSSVNEQNRLAKVDLEPLLAGFRKKPGSHPWIGEHIGKWMHAATLAWANTDDRELRTKLDYAAAELIKAQEPDGYLGTYVPEKRFGLFGGSDWDVWSHKYNLMGLLTYHQYTGSEPALEACRKMGDLLIRTFGPGKKSILSAGTHVGMAATSVLEPIVLLYRFTGDDRYLEFAKYIVQSWDETNGPKVLKTLLAEKNVEKTANGKAYEMLSNLVGLGELARVTGNRQYLEAALNAWQDVVSNRLYLTGSASQGEHFRDDHYLPNQESAHVAETCVTTTWIQLNSQLLRLTGQARFGDQLETTFYNHLSAAQRPDGAQWCYFTALEGKKPYGPGINCCVSSGPRGMALVPQHAWFTFHEQGGDAVVLNLFDSSRLNLPIGGSLVTFDLRSGFPRDGTARLRVGARQPAAFALYLRQPSWAGRLEATVNGQSIDLASSSAGWAVLPSRQWRDGDQIDLKFNLSGRMITGEYGNAGKAALGWGPFILAYDARLNPEVASPRRVGLLAAAAGQPLLAAGAGSDLTFTSRVRVAGREQPVPAIFVPFADAGRDGGAYRVWLFAPGTSIPNDSSLLSEGQEGRSRDGNVEGSINDGDPETFVVTFNGRKANEDWFAVTLDSPAAINKVVFTAGRVFHDGGWFDTSGGKPKIQIKASKDSPWQTVGELRDYPAATATDPSVVRADAPKSFAARLAAPVRAVAVRVVGKPASGDDPNQAFSSCAELAAFEEP